ncbi:MAG TPA: LON peptidase substrate-binding domain-containing protein [Acidimicrobiales bacterium]
MPFPMFPLGMVLLPGAVLPLHVFEPRYRQLVQDCLAGEPEFGVVLIERGSEVGGGDVRRSVATVARLVEVGEMTDGRFALVTVGTRRIRVREWLADDPYPRARVEDWPDAPCRDEQGLERKLGPLVNALRRVLALHAELGGEGAPATVEVTEDPILATYHLAALAPLGPVDMYRVLEAEGPEARVDLLRVLLDDLEEMLRFRLAPPSR